MAGNPKVLELLEEMLASGKSTEEVCRDCSELLPEVRQRWQEFCRIDAEVVALLPGLATLRDVAAIAPVPAASPPRVPGYEVEAVLGRGGMGVVYRARHLALKRTVALKMLAAVSPQPDERARFRVEAEAVARLQHPNIVQIHEVGEADGQPFIALEYVAGGSLAERLKGHVLSPPDAARLVAALAEAMHLAHSRNLVHRDLKPANVLLAPNPKPEIRNPKQTSGDQQESPTPAEGPVSDCEFRIADFVPKVTDFGLARQLDADSGQTRVGVVMGTPNYMAPEQAAGRAHAAGPAADVYALGAILYECLTGRPPFAGATPLETLELVRSSEPAAPSSLNRHAPRDLETVCLKCLRKEPERRYSSAQELADDLGRFVRGEPVAARPVGTAERVWKWVWRRPALAVAAILAVVVVVLGGLGGSAAWLWRRAERAREGEGQARLQAESALQSERLAREQTEQARRGEQAANDRLEEVLYQRRIGLAHADWRENNLAGMERELLACPPRLRLWEWHYLEHLCHSELRGFRVETDGTAMALSSNGERLAASGADGIVRVWDASTGKELPALAKHPNPLSCLCFSPDGSRLATNFTRRAIKVWDARTGQLLLTLPHESVLYAVCFSPDSQTVATAGPSMPVRLWDARNGELTRVLPVLPPLSIVARLSFSLDGELLAVVEGGGPVRVHDVRTGEELSALPRPANGGPLVGVCFSPDGRRLATTWGKGAVRLSDPLTGREEPATADHATLPEAVCFSPDGRFLATGAADRTVCLRDGRNGQPIRILKGHTDAVRSLAFTADGRRLVSAARDGVLKVWDPSEDQEVRILGMGGDARDLLFSPEGRRLGVLQDGTVHLWDVRTRAPLPPLPTGDGPVLGMGFAAAGLRVVRPAPGQVVTVQDVETEQPPRPLRGNPDSSDLTHFTYSFSPDGRLVACIFRREVRLWDADSGQFQRTLQGPRAAVGCIGFSADARFLAAGLVDRNVHVWDVRTGETRIVLTGPSGPVYGVAFHPDGTRLAALAADGTIRTWDLRSGKEVDVRTGETDDFARNGGSLCWSPNGQRLVGVWGRGTVQLWDVPTGEEVLKLPGDNAPRVALRLCFSPDGRFLACCHGGAVRMWTTRTQRE
jgi:WD40 repeat protein/serine/threonine protein kinase